MTDLELLEAAAKAAGIEVWRGNAWQADMMFRRAGSSDGKVSGVQWNPLADDGDALRLATALKLNISQGDFSVCVDDEGVIEESALVRNDAERPAVVRRAIVRAAAAMAQTERTA